MDDDSPELPDDAYQAFMKLESEFRADYENNTEDQNAHWQFQAANYMNKTLAAAKGLGIEALDHYTVLSHNSREFSDTFWLFFRDVDNVIVQIRI